MGLPGDGRLEVQLGLADRQTGRRVPDRLQVLKMAVSVAGLALCGRAKYGGHVVVALNVGLRCEIQIATIRLALTRESILQILFGLATFEIHGSLLDWTRAGDFRALIRLGLMRRVELYSLLHTASTRLRRFIRALTPFRGAV